MKKFFKGILSAGLVLSLLAGCGNTGGQTTLSQNSPQAQKTAW